MRLSGRSVWFFEDRGVVQGEEKKCPALVVVTGGKGCPSGGGTRARAEIGGRECCSRTEISEAAQMLHCVGGRKLATRGERKPVLDKLAIRHASHKFGGSRRLSQKVCDGEAIFLTGILPAAHDAHDAHDRGASHVWPVPVVGVCFASSILSASRSLTVKSGGELGKKLHIVFVEPPFLFAPRTTATWSDSSSWCVLDVLGVFYISGAVEAALRYASACALARDSTD